VHARTVPLRELGLVLAIAIVLVGGCAGSAPSVVSSAAMLDLDVIFVATDLEVVYAMLEAAKAGPGDVVYDHGCGDGRIIVAAASHSGARGVGVDLDPERVSEARENAAHAGVTDRITFLTQDLFATDVSAATVVAITRSVGNWTKCESYSPHKSSSFLICPLSTAHRSKAGWLPASEHLIVARSGTGPYLVCIPHHAGVLQHFIIHLPVRNSEC
jgi:SAM-dependent methyltransferase